MHGRSKEAMATHSEGVGGGVMDRLRQVVCGLHGHDTMLQFEHERMFLRCVSCGHETPGWDLNDAPPTAALQTTAKQPSAVQQPAMQPAIVQRQLISARRVA